MSRKPVQKRSARSRCPFCPPSSATDCPHLVASFSELGAWGEWPFENARLPEVPDELQGLEVQAADWADVFGDVAAPTIREAYEYYGELAWKPAQDSERQLFLLMLDRQHFAVETRSRPPFDTDYFSQDKGGVIAAITHEVEWLRTGLERLFALLCERRDQGQAFNAASYLVSREKCGCARATTTGIFTFEVVNFIGSTDVYLNLARTRSKARVCFHLNHDYANVKRTMAVMPRLVADDPDKLANVVKAVLKANGEASDYTIIESAPTHLSVGDALDEARLKAVFLTAVTFDSGEQPDADWWDGATARWREEERLNADPNSKRNRVAAVAEQLRESATGVEKMPEKPMKWRSADADDPIYKEGWTVFTPLGWRDGSKTPGTSKPRRQR
jgi:hypothetical protein